MAHHIDVGYMVVIPITITVDPESRPVVMAWREGVPIYLVVAWVAVIWVVVGVMVVAATGSRCDARWTTIANLSIGSARIATIGTNASTVATNGIVVASSHGT